MGVIDYQSARFIRRQQALVKLAGERRGFGIERPELRFIGIAQLGPGENKTLVCHLDQTHGFIVEPQRITLLPDAINAGKQRAVQPDIICQFRELGRKRLIETLKFIMRMCRGHGEEDAGDAG